MIRTFLALLHEKNGKVEDAKALMKEALKMCCNRIPIRKLGNSGEVLEFLNRHTKDFPEAEFPR